MDGSAPGARRRDAAGTRQLLLDAARRRFASDGYPATYVRDIAADAGVNVALINRYFASKEGLFRACLVGAVDELRHTVDESMTLDQVPDAIADKLAGPDHDRHPNQLMLLLRSSGDEDAERIRLDILRSFAANLAATARRHPDDPDGSQLMLHAQVALSAALGVAILRSAGLEPLASASRQALADAIRQVIGALLTAR